MNLRWKRSEDQYTETHDGVWKIVPRFWGRVRAVDYKLTRNGQHVGLFDTQSAAKLKADQVDQQNSPLNEPPTA